MIDLRSDTITQQTSEMRSAMATAIVGDDVMGEDPTVNELQELAAKKVGKEAALFVPSGTMGNLIALLAHCDRGDKVIVGDQSHIYTKEAGGMSAIGCIYPFPIPNQPDGTLDIDDLSMAISTNDNPHHANTKLIALENTHNACGGRILTPEYTNLVAELAQLRGIKLHLDGARIFNSSVSLQLPITEFTKSVDSIQFCLSKGLCAPVGSLLCGSREFIYKAIRIRKQLGGGMRQAGFLAAAGIVGLTQMVGRLADDHRRAKQLALGLSGISQLLVDPSVVQTNIINLYLKGKFAAKADKLSSLLLDREIEVDVKSQSDLRLVTHYGIDDQAVDHVIAVFHEIFSNLSLEMDKTAQSKH